MTHQLQPRVSTAIKIYFNQQSNTHHTVAKCPNCLNADWDVIDLIPGLAKIQCRHCKKVACLQLSLLVQLEQVKRTEILDLGD